MKIDIDYRKWWDSSSKGGKDYDGYWYKNDAGRSDVGVKTSKATEDSIKPDIKLSKMESEGFLSHPDIIEWYSNERYLRKCLNSDNIHTRREAKAKIAKIDYYKKLGL